MRVGGRLRWLGTGQTTWSDIRALARWGGQGSAIARARRGDDSWTDSEHMLAMLVDGVMLGNWQRQGDKSRPKPKPVRRPGGAADVQKLGSGAIPAKDFEAWWSGSGTTQEDVDG